MARFARERGYILRFIEYMDVGHTNGWRLDEVVPAAEIVALIDAEMPLVARRRRTYPGEVADRWRYRDGAGEIGVIARSASRSARPARVPASPPRASSSPASSACAAPTCAAPLRAGADDDELRDGSSAASGRARTDRYSELRSRGDDAAAEGGDVAHRRLNGSLCAGYGGMLRHDARWRVPEA